MLFRSDIGHYLRKCEEHGWAVNTDGRWSFTPEGFLISNTLIGDILELQQQELSRMNRFLYREEPVQDGQISIFPKNQQNTSIFPGI